MVSLMLSCLFPSKHCRKLFRGQADPYLTDRWGHSAITEAVGQCLRFIPQF